MADSAPILSKKFSEREELHPARSLSECIVGPDDRECTAGSENWQDRQDPLRSNCNAGTKRKHDEEQASTNIDGSSTSSFGEAVATFLSSGCCIIPNALPKTYVQACHKKASSDLVVLQETLEQRRKEAGTDPHMLAAAHRVDYDELVARDGGRSDVRYDLYKYPFSAPGLSYNGIVMALVRELLGGGDISLLYEGVMWALAEETTKPDDNDSSSSACHQKWHADGGHLFHHGHQPPHCINVFFPLMDMKDEHGPTEVKPGSHILRLSKGHSDVDPPTTLNLTANAGDAILFDYRLQHRGRANVSKQPRPILYLAYAKPWFKDAGNRRSGQSIFQSSDPRRRLPWMSRLLTGRPLPMGEGFVEERPSDDSTFQVRRDKKHPDGGGQSGDKGTIGALNLSGSGEQWMLFKMNVQLDGVDEEPEIVFYAGDVPVEKATQFCLEYGLPSEFIPLLTGTIQQQVDARQANLSITY